MNIIFLEGCNQWTQTKVSSSSPSLKKLTKSLQPNLESSSIQTAEPIVKFHTTLEMWSHDGSAHTFGSSLQKGVLKKDIFGVFWNKS